MNPQTEEESDGRKTNKEPKEGSDPVGNGVQPRGIICSRGGCSILQQKLDVRFKQCRTGEFGGIVVDGDRLILQVTHELISFLLRRKLTLVAS